MLSLLSIQGPTGQIVNIETCIRYSNMDVIEGRSDGGEESYL